MAKESAFNAQVAYGQHLSLRAQGSRKYCASVFFPTERKCP